MPITRIILPEIVLAAVACLLMLMGVSGRASTRRLTPWLALASLFGVFAYLAFFVETPSVAQADATAAVRLHAFGYFVKLLAAGVGVLLVLANWPTNDDATGNPALNFGSDAGEFFGLMLLSLSGLMLVASANDVMLLFLAIELASLPAYVMVSVSRPVPVAQEAGVKYFFLGAMAAAVLLFGFSYLYGTTGMTSLYDIAVRLRGAGAEMGVAPTLSAWETLAFVVIIAGLAFKLAAVPFHTYVGDVYQGAATPVTAFLAFVPKASGLVALVKVLFVMTAGTWVAPDVMFKLLWWLAVLTMTFGNVLGLLQNNVKRVLAYSSIAHSGYMLVGVTALLANRGNQDTVQNALQGILFYLAAYGIMNTGAFAVLTLLPSRDPQPGTSAETFDDLAGTGRRHIGLGLAMAVSCFSLIGLPLTVGFFGKLLLIQPALNAGLYGLVVVTVVNAAISAAYYLRIVGTMFLRPDPAAADADATGGAPVAHGRGAPLEFTTPRSAMPIVLCVALSAVGTLLFGSVFPATQILVNSVATSAVVENPIVPAIDVAAADENLTGAGPDASR